MKQIILDAPLTPVSRIQIAKIGDGFKDKRYGEFSITRQEVEAWGRNLALLPGGRALIDADHSAERPQPFRSTEALGWITGVDVENDTPMASVEWTPVGKQAILDKRFMFISPTYGDWTDEQGATHRDVLQGAGVTNRPFLNMATISLASADQLARALERDPVQHVQALAAAGSLGDALTAAQNVLRETTLDPADSRGHMKITPKIRKQLAVADAITDEAVQGILKALGVTDDADEAATLKHLDGALATPAAPDPVKPDTKTLEQMAADAGMKILDAGAFDQLVSGAAAGLEAQKQLKQARFDTAWTAAVDGLRRLESERDTYRHFYELDADNTLKLLEDGPVLFNARPIGSNDHSDPAKIDPRNPNFELAQVDQKARKMMLDKGAPESEYHTYLKAALEGRTI